MSSAIPPQVTLDKLFDLGRAIWSARAWALGTATYRVFFGDNRSKALDAGDTQIRAAEKGSCGIGIGTTAAPTNSYISPTDGMTVTGTKRDIAGLTFEFL